MKTKKESLRLKFIAILLIIAAVPACLLGALSIVMLRSSLLDQTYNDLRNTALHTANILDKFVLQSMDTIRIETQLPAITEYLSQPHYERVGSQLERDVIQTLHILFSRHSVYTQFYSILDASGEELLSTQVNRRGNNLSREPYFRRVMQTGQTFASPILFDEQTNDGTIFFASPLRSKQTKKIVGVLVVAYNASILQRLIVQGGKLRDDKLDAILINKELMRLADTKYHASEKRHEHLNEHLSNIENLRVIKDWLSPINHPDIRTTPDVDRTSILRGHLHGDQSTQFGAFVNLKTNDDWALLITKPEQLVLHPVNQQTCYSVAILVAIFTFISLAMLYVSNHIITPIVRLSESASKISGGDFSETPPTLSNDELGVLAHAFNDMRTKLQKMILGLENKVRERTQDLENKNAELETRSIQLKVANEELEAFSYSVSHDLRAPLRSIDGFSLALLEDYSGQLDDQGVDYLNRVRANAGRMSVLIDALLKLSRINQTPITRTRVNMSEIAHEILSELKESEPDRSISFIVGQNMTVNGDAKLIRIMLDNLLRNAWKYSSKKESSSIVFSHCAGLLGTFYIQDNGVGFSPDSANKLFIAFQRLHSDEEFCGTGVGLATVKRIVNRHQGKIWARGEREVGATFFFSL